MLKRLLLITLLITTVFASTSDNYAPIEYDCDGSTTEFTFSFSIGQTSDLEVILKTTATETETVLVEDINYTVSATNNDYSNGGTVTTIATYSSGRTLTIRRDTPKSQDALLIDAGKLRLASLEDGLDKLTRITQDHEEELGRCIKIPKTESTNVDLASALNRADKNATFDANGGITATDLLSTGSANISAFGATLIDDADAVAAIATLQGVPVINVKNDTYGVTGNGTTNDSANIIVAAADAVNKTLLFPPGTYYLPDAITFDNTITLWFMRGAKLKLLNSDVIVQGDIIAGSYQIFDLAGTGIVDPDSNKSVDIAMPEWWGAVADDSTDCTTALQNAIDFVSNAGGGTVELLPGTYLVSATLNTIASIAIQGDGRHNTVIKLADGSDTDVFNSTHPSGDYRCIFRDFRVNGNSANNSSGSGFNGHWVIGRWYNVQVHAFAEYAFNLSGDSGGDLFLSACSGGSSNIGLQSNRAGTVIIGGNYENNTTANIYFKGIVGGVIQGTFHDGAVNSIVLEDCKGIVVSGLHIVGWSGYGVYLSKGSRGNYIQTSFWDNARPFYASPTTLDNIIMPSVMYRTYSDYGRGDNFRLDLLPNARTQQVYQHLPVGMLNWPVDLLNAYPYAEMGNEVTGTNSTVTQEFVNESVFQAGSLGSAEIRTISTAAGGYGYLTITGFDTGADIYFSAKCLPQYNADTENAYIQATIDGAAYDLSNKNDNEYWWVKHEVPVYVTAGTTAVTLRLIGGAVDNQGAWWNEIFAVQSLLKNGGFEETYTTGLSADWTKSGGTPTEDTTNYYSGASSQAFAGDEDEYLRQTTTLVINKWYRLVGKIRLTAGSATVAVSGKSYQEPEIDATNWNNIDFVFRSGGTTQYVTITCTTDDTTFNLDGFALYEVSAAPHFPQVELDKIQLLSITTISLAANADTTIYTVPAGRRCILDHAKLVAGDDASTSDISIGQNTAETDFIGTTNLNNLNAQYDMVLLAPVPSATPAILKSYAGTTVIEAKVSNQAGGATNTLYLYGTLY